MSRWLGVPAALWLVTLGCGEEKRAPFFDPLEYEYEPTRAALERGLTADDFVRCDIRKEDCQQMLFGATAEAYGADAPRPPTYVVSPREFDEYQEAMITSADLAAALSHQDALFRTLALLGLLDPAFAEPSAMSVGSYGRLLAAYFFIPKEVLVIDWHMDMDAPLAVLTLSHEYTHALQDEAYDLTKRHDAIDGTDTRHGLLSLVEGEAELYATLVAIGYAEEKAEYWRGLRMDILAAALGSEAPFLVATVNFPYILGHEFATFTWLAGGNQALADLYGAIPKSSRQILAGAGAETPLGGWDEAILDTAEGTLPTGFRQVEVARAGASAAPFEDSFGAWILHVFLEQMSIASGAREIRLPGESVATELRGDHVVAFERGKDGAYVVVWRMRFEPGVDPRDVRAEIADGAPAHFRLREAKGDLLLFAGETEEAVDAFVDGFGLPGESAGVQTGEPSAP